MHYLQVEQVEQDTKSSAETISGVIIRLQEIFSPEKTGISSVIGYKQVIIIPSFLLFIALHFFNGLPSSFLIRFLLLTWQRLMQGTR